MSSYKKAQGTTSRLLKIAENVLRQAEAEEYMPVLSSLKQDHLDCVKSAIKDAKIQQETLNELDAEFERLKNFLEAVQTIEEVSVRFKLKDLICLDLGTSLLDMERN
jgi:aspartokinase